MAVRKFFLNVGQSNASPFTDGVGWRTLHFTLDLTQVTAPTLAQGAYRNTFTLPGSWPVPFNLPLDIQGRAIKRIRYLNFYHPSPTGYATYPHTGRVADDTGGTANSSSAFYVEQVFDASAATQGVQITRERTGETRTISAVSVAGLPAGAGSRITLSVAFTAIGTAPAIPDDGEEFSYQIKLASAVSGSTVTLTMKFGLLSGYTDSLLGLKLTLNSVTFDVVAWNNTTRVATLSSAPTGAAGDVATLGPRHGTFESWSYFLPFSPFEAFTTVGKANPYPQGFNYPGFLHIIPLAYNSNPAGGAIAYPDSGSYTTGLAVRISEALGEDVYVVSSEVGGTPLGQNVQKAGAGGFGWHDPAQHNCWSPGTTGGTSNNCFGRMLIELDAAIAAAALEGDTIEVLGVFHVHGEGDAQNLTWATDWERNLRTFIARTRTELKSRNLWPKAAESIPWVFAKPSRKAVPALAFVETVHTGTDRVVADDPYMRTFTMDDATTIDGTHYNGNGALLLEDRAFAAIQDIWRTSADTGAVAICNLALSHLGELPRVTSIDPSDGSAAANLCAQFYGRARDCVLEMRRWGFATRRVALTDVGSTLPQWEFAYLVPADTMTVIKVLPSDATDDVFQTVTLQSTWVMDQGSVFEQPTAQKFVIEQEAGGRRILYCNQEDAVLQYVARVTDTSRYPQLFVQALSWKLASDLAGPLLKGAEGMKQKQACLAFMQLAVGTAAEEDARQQRLAPEPIPNWLQH